MKKVFGNICTGQKLCYNNSSEISCPAEGKSFFGQDPQYAAKGSCTPQSYIIKTPNSIRPDEKVVLDENTKLEWQRTISGETYTFYQAITYCADLEYAGYDDWRLPTTKELLSTVDQSLTYPVDSEYFPGTQGLFWTSKRNVDSTNYAWHIDFDIRTASRSLATDTHYARCVRGTVLPDSSFESFTRNGDEIFKDNVTGLMWHGNLKYDVAWSAALSYCENSTYGGYRDWRMPNFNELMSIVNYDRYNPTTDIPSISGGITVLTSTTAIYNPTYSFEVYFGDGNSSVWSKTNSSSAVLCVR